jgi:hypothetical protein
VPAGNEEVVMLKAGALIANDNCAVAETDALSVTFTVKLDDAALVGVPDIVPPESPSPAGRDPVETDHVYGGDPPVAFSGCEYGTPIVPAGNGEVVIRKAGALIVNDSWAVAETDALSVTLTVKLDDAALVGVPDIVPPERTNPAGSDPVEMDHVYGGDPPVALSVWEYATPTVPAGNEEVVIRKAGALVVNDNGAVADTDALSVTLTVKFDDPAAVGVPDIVLPERPRPAGRVPLEMDQVYGGDPPVASSVCEYGTPTVPAGNEDVLITSGVGSTVSDKAFETVAVLLSAACTVNVAVPAPSGVPLITPVVAERVSA